MKSLCDIERSIKKIQGLEYYRTIEMLIKETDKKGSDYTGIEDQEEFIQEQIDMRKAAIGVLKHEIKVLEELKDRQD